MRTAIVSGSGGLVGAEAVSHFAEAGYRVIGIENDMRGRLFGVGASTHRVTERLLRRYPTFSSEPIDIRDADGVARVVRESRRELELVVHAAAQPSHDWSATDPCADFAINASGTLNVLEATRRHAPSATFIFMSTNKVYGDRPNALPLVEGATRLDLPAGHPYFHGVDTSMAIDRALHSPFGASKAAADLLVQEYGRYFDMPTVCFRAGCLTGPNHAGAELHGFLSYLMRCTVSGTPYTVFGHGGRQVRDNIHAADLVRAFAAFHAAPRAGAVYNIGGGREHNCSVLEAIALCERIAGASLGWTYSDTGRVGDHRWWISDLDELRRDYPEWRIEWGIADILRDIYAANAERWTAEQVSPVA